MRRLMLLRHAKSDWSRNPSADHARTLAARGREAAPLLGAYMSRHALVPDKAIVSTAERTRETWTLVADAFARKPATVYDERLYEATPESILKVVMETAEGVHSLLLVGHNPGLQELAALLIASGDVEQRQQLLEKFPTAALAVIDFPIDEWSRIHRHAGRLDRFVSPRTLDAATD